MNIQKVFKKYLKKFQIPYILSLFNKMYIKLRKYNFNNITLSKLIKIYNIIFKVFIKIKNTKNDFFTNNIKNKIFFIFCVVGKIIKKSIKTIKKNIELNKTICHLKTMVNKHIGFMPTAYIRCTFTRILKHKVIESCSDSD
jgi:hypothetical protein